MNLFPQLSDESKVWIYQSQTELSDEQKVGMQQSMNSFVEGWAAHGSGLFAEATILEDYFLVFAVDESKAKASGCSIDSSVRFVKQLQEKLNLDFFNRLNVLVEIDGAKKIVSYHELDALPSKTQFNLLAKNLGELRRSWRI